LVTERGTEIDRKTSFVILVLNLAASCQDNILYPHWFYNLSNKWPELVHIMHPISIPMWPELVHIMHPISIPMWPEQYILCTPSQFLCDQI
jgi:hypothetical protein